MEASSRSSLEAGGEGEKRSGSVGDTPVSARTFNLSTYRKAITSMSRPPVSPEEAWTTSTPQLPRMCQSPWHSPRPAVRKVGCKWKCQACLDGIAARKKRMGR